MYLALKKEFIILNSFGRLLLIITVADLEQYFLQD